MRSEADPTPTRDLAARLTRRPAARLALVAAGVAAGLLLSGCSRDTAIPAPDSGVTAPLPGLESQGAPVDGATPVPGGQSAPVVPSAVYAAEVGGAAQGERIAELTEVVERLRAASTSGWQARQDDTSGFAAELSGGRITMPGSAVESALAFMTAYGAAFGPPADFDLTASEYAATGTATVTGVQVVGDVPVVGGALVMPVTRQGEGHDVSFVRASVVDVEGVATEPVISAAKARRIVTKALGSDASADPALAVFSDTGEPRLAWGVVVVSPPQDPQGVGLAQGQFPATVYVDAENGEILGLRSNVKTGSRVGAADPAQPTGPDLGKYDWTLPAAGTPVKVKGTLPDGSPIEVNAERLRDGTIVMVDATGPGANRKTKKGIIAVFDGSRVDPRSNALGPIIAVPNGQAVPTDALYAMWAARKSLDYYRNEFGRLSFDGQNSPLVATVNYTEGDVCLDNAFFLTAPGESRMTIGVPCEDNGVPTVNTWADLATIGHEVTHGVTHTNALEFAADNVQQGAIDEGTSDYFGVIIENLSRGEVGTTGSFYACYGLDHLPMCGEMTDGQRGMRDINSGATFDDYAFTLTDPFGFNVGDDGHQNSMIWTNALWKARTRLAALDGGDLINSQKARTFDKAVNRATTTYLTSDTDLVGAAEAVQRAAAEVGLGATEQQIISDQFRTSKLCRGCTQPTTVPNYVAASSKVKTRPDVAGDRVVYTQWEGPLRAVTMVTTPGSPASAPAGPTDALSLRTAAHENLVAQAVARFSADGGESDEILLVDISTNKTVRLASSGDPTVAPAISGTGVAWADYDGTVTFRTLDGATTKTLRTGSPVAHLATDGNLVAIQQDEGVLSVWDTTTGRRQQIDRFGPARDPRIFVPSGGLAMSGSRIAALSGPMARGEAIVYDLAASTRTVLSDGAAPFGIAMNDDLVVWSEVTGPLPGKINELTQRIFPDTELRGYSLRTGKLYEIVDPRGQQGFPALGDNLLAWQETAGGGNDIVAIPIPTLN